MTSYVPYEEDKPTAPVPQSKYLPYEDDGKPSKQQVQAMLSQPRDTTPEGTLTEAGKGVGRGLLGMAQAFGHGLTPAEGTIGGQSIALAANPDIAQANQQVQKLLAPNPQASGFEHGAGVAGEIGGGMLFGKGGVSGMQVSGTPRALLAPNSFKPPTMSTPTPPSDTPPQLFGEAGSVIAKEAAVRALTAMGMPYSRTVVRALTALGRKVMQDDGGAVQSGVPVPGQPLMRAYAQPIPPSIRTKPPNDMYQRLGAGAMAPLFSQGDQ